MRVCAYICLLLYGTYMRGHRHYLCNSPSRIIGTYLRTYIQCTTIKKIISRRKKSRHNRITGHNYLRPFKNPPVLYLLGYVQYNWLD